MSTTAAIRVAIDLMHVPSRVRYARLAPLPADVTILLQIAAGDQAAEVAAAEAVDRTREKVRQASVFFIEQVLLGPDTDSYRVLGVDRKASASELRRNMALLLRWLHPDMHHSHSIFAGRVIAAWENLKTPERRAAYDRERMVSPRKKVRRKGGGPSSSRGSKLVPAPRPSFLRRALLLLRGRPR